MSDITKVKDLPATVTTAIEAIIKLSRYLVITTAVTTFFLDLWLKHMSLLSIKESSLGMWISVLFWISISIVAIDFLRWVVGRIVFVHKAKEVKKNFAKVMNELTDTEKDMVYKIYRNDTFKLNVIGDASVAELIDFGIIYCSKTGDRRLGFSCGLQATTRNFLMENPNSLEEYASQRSIKI